MMPIMKKWLPGLLILLLSLLLWKGDELVGHRKSVRNDSRKADSRGLSPADAAGVHTVHPTKVSEREAVSIKPTHGPQQLKDFFLPPIEIDGLTLGAALQKLKAAYEETCRQTGEVPLSLVFDIPAGQDGLLRVKLGARNLDASVRMLAAASGLTVRRDGSTYHLEEPADLAGRSRKELSVPPDIAARLLEMGGGSSSSHDLRALFEAMGLELDQSTRIEYSPSTSTLQIETESAADLTALSGMTDQVIKEVPTQQKLDTKMLEIPAGVDWTAPDLAGQYSDGQIQLMMREIAQTKGIDLLTLPSITARNGETATIEIIRDLIVPTDDSGEHFETHQIGHVMKLGGSLLGLGQRLDMDYTDTEGGFDPVTGRAQINTRAEIKEATYIGDGSTKLQVQTRADGSRRVVLTTGTRIDATGKPVRDGY